MSNVEVDIIKDQIEILKKYMIMNIDRNDMHSVWDCAIDIQRLMDKMESAKNESD